MAERYLRRFGSHAASPSPAYDRAMRPGVTVRYSGKWLANTGQRTGPAGRERFVVRPCLCARCLSGEFVCVDRDAPSLEYYTTAELAEDPGLAYLHIARTNLTIVGKPSHRDDT